jgi:O-antigen/teichoic acid export membrane protein
MAVSGIVVLATLTCGLFGVFSSLGNGGLVAAALFSVVRTKFGLETSISQSLGSFGRTSLIQGFASALTSLLLIVTVQFSHSIAVLFVLQSVLYSAATVFVMRKTTEVVRRREPSRSGPMPTKKEVLLGAAPLGFMTAGGLLFSHGDKLILVLLLSKADTAKYAVLLSIAYFIHHATAAVCQPVQFIDFDREKVFESGTLRKYVLLNSTIAGFSAAFAYIFTRPILSLVLADSTPSMTTGFRIAVWSVALYSLSVVPYFVAVRFGENRRVVESALLGSIFSAVACVFLSTRFGLRGALASNAFYAVSAVPLIPVFTGGWKLTRIHLQLVGPAVLFGVLVLLGSQLEIWP